MQATSFPPNASLGLLSHMQRKQLACCQWKTGIAYCILHLFFLIY